MEMEVNSAGYWRLHRRMMAILQSLGLHGPDVDFSATIISQHLMKTHHLAEDWDANLKNEWPGIS
jgi:hypothetical protein